MCCDTSVTVLKIGFLSSSSAKVRNRVSQTSKVHNLILPEIRLLVEGGARNQLVALLHLAGNRLGGEFINETDLVSATCGCRQSRHVVVITVTDAQVLQVEAHRKYQSILVNTSDRSFLERLTPVPHTDRH